MVAQEAATDTLAESRVLQEVVVAAPRVIHKFDSDVYYPSKSAKELSKDGERLETKNCAASATDAEGDNCGRTAIHIC